MWITENQLDEWVRGNSKAAQGTIVELVWRLVGASCPRPRERRFPLGDSIDQHGADGYLQVDLDFDPFVPEGISYWEIGTGLDARRKATADFVACTEAVPDNARAEATFVFVTPLSGRRGWKDSWDEDAQREWLDHRHGLYGWKALRIIDGTDLVDWVHEFYAVNSWLLQKMLGRVALGLETVGERWDLIKSIGAPPPLTPMVFLANRDQASAKLSEVLADTAKQLKLDTRYMNDVVDFVCAHVAALDTDSRVEAEGRCIIAKTIDAWEQVVLQRERHILIADALVDLTGDSGTKLIQKARRSGHAVVFRGDPGGIPDPTRVALPLPRIGQLQDALETAGYPGERARTLAQRSDGNLGSLLRCIQNLSLHPSWAEGSAAAELAIAELLGSWFEGSDADQLIVGEMSGNSYGEWIGEMRKVALGPDTPLVQQDGQWRFVARFEGWYALGPLLYDDHIARLNRAAVAVLGEADPALDLPKDERFAAEIFGKARKYSTRLRHGLADTLALLGSRGDALINCSLGKAEATARVVVRTLLAGATSKQWASLNDVLPLLAEAAPDGFLECLQSTLDENPAIFDGVFAEEGDGIMGRSYSTGILWALETLAWEPAYLSRVVMCLGSLADRDPGGLISNRPANSLRTILLPWLPQTLAAVSQRRAAASSLVKEYPRVGWQLLLQTLPRVHSYSVYTRRPKWRSLIPDDWSPGTTHQEFAAQVRAFGDLAFELAVNDWSKMRELLDRWENLPLETADRILEHLQSAIVASLPVEARHALWTSLVQVVDKHRRFVDADWAIGPERLARLVEIAAQLDPGAPTLRHRRLFSENDIGLLENGDDYQELYRRLTLRRDDAVTEVMSDGGVRAVLSFATTVDAPWQVGAAAARVSGRDVDSEILPVLLDPQPQSLSQFAGAFVLGRFDLEGADWIDRVIDSSWSAEQLGKLFSFLPFTRETWEQARRVLGESGDSTYWKLTPANPYQTDPADLAFAARRLEDEGRLVASLRCTSRMVAANQPIVPADVSRVLLAAMRTPEEGRVLPRYEIIEIIRALQEDQNASTDDLLRVEWAYLPLLAADERASPKTLERRLSVDPAFFAEVVNLVFRSKNDPEAAQEAGDPSDAAIAMNGYRLLSDWSTPPGALEDGGYDGAALSEWLDAAARLTEATGRLEVAMTMVGHVLTYAPADPNGLWIHSAVAAALNLKAANDLRSGFLSQVLNSRGAHWVDPTGAAETALADKYRAQALALDEAGYSRFAATIRQIAITYEHESDRVQRDADIDD